MTQLKTIVDDGNGEVVSYEKGLHGSIVQVESIGAGVIVEAKHENNKDVFYVYATRGAYDTNDKPLKRLVAKIYQEIVEKITPVKNVPIVKTVKAPPANEPNESNKYGAIGRIEK